MRRLILTMAAVLSVAAPPVVTAQTPLTPPQLVAQIPTLNDAYEVILLDHYALVPNYSTGLLVIDVADPVHPSVVATYDTPGLAIQCDLSGHLVFVADHVDGGLQVLNLAAPTAPTFVGSYVTGGPAVMAARHDNFVLLGYVTGGVDVLDVSVPSHPQLLGAFPTESGARHAVFDWPYAYVGDYGYGVIVVDLSAPAAPVQVGGIVASRALGLVLDGDVLYAACANGLRTIDVSTPTVPASIDRVALPGPAVKVVRAGNYAVLAAHVTGGLQVVDVSDPADLSIAASYVTGRYSYGIAVSGDYAFLADGPSFKVFRIFDSAVRAESTSFGRLKAIYR